MDTIEYKKELQRQLKEQYGIQKNISQALSLDHCEQLLNSLQDKPGFIELVKSMNEKLKMLGRSNQKFGLLRANAERRARAARKDPINAIVANFNFPEEVKTACEQYLLYFTEFLKDVGIEAVADIREEDGLVNFLVEPKDKHQALENIQELLGIYLKLPNSSVHNAYQVSLTTEISVQRLTAQILHLQGQLSLASAIIESKDACIAQQRQVIQGTAFTPQILMDALEEDKEPLLGGLLAVKELEVGGAITINLPQLLRLLKERFSSR